MAFPLNEVVFLAQNACQGGSVSGSNLTGNTTSIRSNEIVTFGTLSVSFFTNIKEEMLNGFPNRIRKK